MRSNRSSLRRERDLVDRADLKKLPDDVAGGHLAENIMYFGRVLRRAGLPIGPGQVIEAMRAVSQVGLSSRKEFYWSLFSVFVNRRDQREVFDQAFHIF